MIRHIETLVRVFLGLPIATAYFYVRHFNENYAYLLLIAGMVFLIAGMKSELSQPVVAVHGKRP